MDLSKTLLKEVTVEVTVKIFSEENQIEDRIKELLINFSRNSDLILSALSVMSLAICILHKEF